MMREEVDKGHSIEGNVVKTSGREGRSMHHHDCFLRKKDFVVLPSLIAQTELDALGSAVDVMLVEYDLTGVKS